jgi:hypothetical protein
MPNALTIALALTCVALLVAVGWLLRERRRKTSGPLPTEWSLTPRPVFTQHERRLHRQLREALPQHLVLAKLPLVRFCQPVHAEQVRFWFDLLGSVNVSFAICSANGRVLAAIDLDDTRNPQRRSVQIKQAVLGACRIRYVRYPADQIPSVPELQLLVPVSAPTSAPTAPPTMAMPLLGAASARSGKRSARWPDSSYLPRDSVFERGENSRFAQSSSFPPSELPEGGGVVVDPPPVRH